MTISTTITVPPTAPSRTDPDNFRTEADAYVDWLSNDLASELNTIIPEINAILPDINSAEQFSNVALASANFLGSWADLTGAATVPSSVAHDGFAWLLLEDIADITAEEPGTSAKWQLIRTNEIVRAERTSNISIAFANKANFIDITSGTFSQTFDAISTLPLGWYCYIANSGTGDITLDPNGAELIDGVASFIMYPNEVRLVMSTGSALKTKVLQSFYKTFTASGTFYKPPGYSLFSGLLWGGGASGAKNDAGITFASGGGGGACFHFDIEPSALATSETVTIAASAAGVTTNSAGIAGNNSSFGTTPIFISYGGGAGYQAAATVSGGGGGGILSVGTNGSTGNAKGGLPFIGPISTDYLSQVYGGGGCLSTSVGGYSVFGGGGGGSGVSSGSGGGSMYGGGGGGGNNAAGGSSTFGGNGGSGVAGADHDGSAPGGGGGKTMSDAKSGDGARGELRIWGTV